MLAMSAISRRRIPFTSEFTLFQARVGLGDGGDGVNNLGKAEVNKLLLELLDHGVAKAAR